MRRFGMGRVCAPVMAAVLALGCATSRADRPNPSGGGQPAPDGGEGPLTLDGAIARAMAHNEGLAGLQGRVLAADQERRRAGDWRDPELAFLTRGQTAESDRFVPRSAPAFGSDAPTSMERVSATAADGEDNRVGVRVYPPNPWLRSARVSAATARFRAAEEDLRHARWLLETDVRQAFVEAVYAESDLRILNDILALRKDMRRLAKDRMAKGQATLYEDFSAARRHLETLSDYHRAEQQRLSTRQSLAALVALPADSLRIADRSGDTVHPEQAASGAPREQREPAAPRRAVPPSVDAAASDIERLAREALKRRSDLSAARWRAVAAEAAYREARSERIPWFTHVEASYDWGRETDARYAALASPRDAPDNTDAVSDATRDDTRTDEWRIGFRMTVPLFSWMSGAPEAGRAGWQHAEAMNAVAAQRVFDEVRSAVQALLDIGRRRRMFDAEAEPLLRDMQAALSGAETQTGLMPEDHLRMREQVLLSRRSKLRADFEYRLAAVRVLRVLGYYP